MTALAEQHPRWGYRMIKNLLVEEGGPVNVKRVHRLCVKKDCRCPHKG